MLAQDLDLKISDIQQLADAEAVAALFARLGLNCQHLDQTVYNHKMLTEQEVKMAEEKDESFPGCGKN